MSGVDDIIGSNLMEYILFLSFRILLRKQITFELVGLIIILHLEHQVSRVFIILLREEIERSGLLLVCQRAISSANWLKP